MKRYWKSALALALTASIMQGNVWAVSFPDLAGHWAETELQHAVETGLLSGMTDGSLQPEGKLTRAQMAVMLSNAFGAQKTSNLSQYTDVSSQAWYYEGLSKAYAMGVMQGVSEVHMAPDQELTREQAMTILARAFCLPDGDLSYLNQFSDGTTVNSWAKSSVAALAQGGYLTGMTELRPTDPMTRAEFAQLMDRMVTLYYGEDRVQVEPYQTEVEETPSEDESVQTQPDQGQLEEGMESTEDSTDTAENETEQVPQPSDQQPLVDDEETTEEESDGEQQKDIEETTEETKPTEQDQPEETSNIAMVRSSVNVVSGAEVKETAQEEDVEPSEEETSAKEDDEKTQPSANEPETEPSEVTQEEQQEEIENQANQDGIIPWQEPDNKVIDGNVMVALPDQTLEGYTIRGDLIVAEGIEDGTLTLKDTTVTGRLVLRAGTDVEDCVTLEGDSSINTVVMAQQASKIYFNIPEDATVQQVYVTGDLRQVWLSGAAQKLVLDAENITFYGEALTTQEAQVLTTANVNLDADSEVESLYLDQASRGTKINNEGTITNAQMEARDCHIIGNGAVKTATIVGRGCTISDENCEITEDIDTGLEQVNVALTANYDSLPVNQPLQITATFTGVDRERVCSVRWLKDGQPMQGFANDAFVLTEGKTSTLNWSIEPYKEMPTAAQFTLEVTYDGDTKRISKTIALENYSQEYYDKYDAQKILEKIQPAYVKVTTVRDTAIFENSNLIGQFDSIPKGTVCNLINLYDSAGKANIIMPDGRSGWVADWNISISRAKFTEEGDYEDYEKEIFVNNMGYSSKTDYLVWINIRYQKVNVFVGSEGNWDLVRVAPCATGKSTTPTNLGVFEYYRRDAVWDFGTYYVKPALRFNDTGEAMHSRPKRPNGSILESYMGTPVSHGCVRMLDEDIWWLSDNLPLHSTVVVY